MLNHTPAEQQVTLPDEYARFGRNGAPGAHEFRIAARDVVVLFENA